MKEYLQKAKKGYAYPFFEEGEDYNNVWDVRKKGLGLLLSVKTTEKAQPFIEDACVPVEHLPKYIERTVDFCDSLNTKVVLYAHASVGVIHVRPILDLRKQEDIDTLKKISSNALDMVIEYGGSWSGEHGDGLARSPGIKKFYGDKIYDDFKKIKQAFDPDGLMNPGKITDSPPIDQNLRYGSDYEEIEVETIYKYRKEAGFSTLINMCNGVGVCQRTSDGVMCPSYKATLDEKHSTRGRANALRLTLSGEIDMIKLSSPELLEVMDLCVSCKSCKTECPSNVDMAKLKSEVLQKKYDNYGYGIREFLILKSDILSKYLSGRFSGLINAIQKSKIFRKVLERIVKIDARRILPNYAKFSLMKWYKSSFVPTSTSAKGKIVILFADTYINYHEPQIGIAIINFLDKYGFNVKLIDFGGSKRPLISNGFLRKAAKYGEKLTEKLIPHIEKGIPIIVCEPGSYSALVEDIPDLIDDEFKANMLKTGIVSIEKFISNIIDDGIIKNKIASKLSHHVLHGHCHQKAIEGMEPLENIFKNVEGTYEILDVGCCGMAGAFGFEKEHFELSKRIYNIELSPKISSLQDDIIILATGFSCRHQIEDFGKKRVKHWIEVLKPC